MIWKEISNYSGCSDFEQLQYYLNIIYKFQMQLVDFQTQHPVYLAKLLHMHQLAIKYYEHSTEELQEYEYFVDKQQMETQVEITKTEKKLIENKTKIKLLQQRLKTELKQRDKFIEKVTKTQLIQCVYCEKVVTTFSQFDLHMQSFHKREFNKQEVDVVSKAIQNQLLTQQLSTKIQSQQQQSYLALNYQMLQQTKEQLALETKEFIQNTLHVEDKVAQIHQQYTSKINNLEDEIERKLNIIKINNEKEEKMREEQVREKVLELQNNIREELERNKFLLKQRSTRRLMTSGQVQASQDKRSMIYQSNSSLQRGQTMNIKSLANLDQDEVIVTSSRDLQKTQRQIQEGTQFINKPNELDPPTLANIEQQESQELLESQQMANGQMLKPPPVLEQKQSKFIKRQQQKLSSSEADEQSNRSQVQIEDDEEQIDYIAQNLIQYREAVEKQQMDLFEMLMNRSKGIRIQFTQLQQKYFTDILEKNIAKEIAGIESNEIKTLKKLYDEVSNKYHQNKTKVEEKLQLYSVNDDVGSQENDSRRPTSFLNIRSRKQSIKHQKTPSQG